MVCGVGERENVDGEQQAEDGIEGTGGDSEQVELEIVAAEETAGHGKVEERESEDHELQMEHQKRGNEKTSCEMAKNKSPADAQADGHNATC